MSFPNDNFPTNILANPILFYNNSHLFIQEKWAIWMYTQYSVSVFCNCF